MSRSLLMLGLWLGGFTASTAQERVNPDTMGPRFQHAVLLTSNSVRLTFDEPLTNHFGWLNVFLSTDGGILSGGPFIAVTGWALDGVDTNGIGEESWTVTLDSPLIRDLRYEVLLLTNAVRDQFSNPFQEDDGIGLGGIIRPIIMGHAPVIALDDVVWLYNQEGSLTNDLSQASPPYHDPAYDDSGWLGPGAALLGYETRPPPAPFAYNTPLLPPAQGGPNATYLRAHFYLATLEPHLPYLLLQYYLDDAAILHLNGVEVHRSALYPPVVYDFETRATGIVGNGWESLEGPFILDSSSLVVGDNVLAVEVRTGGANSADVTWGAVLSIPRWGEPQPMPPTIMSQPAGLTVNEGEPFSLTVVASGTLPLAYQWRLNGINITNNGNNASYTVPHASLSQSGDYDVIITNCGGMVTSDPATVTVHPTIQITRISMIDNHIIIEHNGARLGVDLWVQETTTLAADPSLTLWTNQPSGPHPSPHQAGPPIGTRFFRLTRISR